MRTNNIGLEDSYRFESSGQRLYLPPHLASVEEGRMGGGELWDSSTGENIGERNEDNFNIQFVDAKAGYYIVCDNKGDNHRLISNPNLVIKKKQMCRETGDVFYISIYDAEAERKAYEEYYKEPEDSTHEVIKALKRCDSAAKDTCNVLKQLVKSVELNQR